MKKSLKSKGLAANIITAVVWLFIFLYSLTILGVSFYVQRQNRMEHKPFRLSEIVYFQKLYKCVRQFPDIYGD